MISVPPIPLISDFPTNDRIIDGKDMMDDAKMIGITPAVFTFSGILDDCPPTIFLPAIFLEYCTGILLSAPFRISTSTTTAMITTAMIIHISRPRAMVLPFTKVS